MFERMFWGENIILGFFLGTLNMNGNAVSWLFVIVETAIVSLLANFIVTKIKPLTKNNIYSFLIIFAIMMIMPIIMIFIKPRYQQYTEDQENPVQLGEVILNLPEKSAIATDRKSYKRNINYKDNQIVWIEHTKHKPSNQWNAFLFQFNPDTNVGEIKQISDIPLGTSVRYVKFDVKGDIFFETKNFNSGSGKLYKYQENNEAVFIEDKDSVNFGKYQIAGTGFAPNCKDYVPREEHVQGLFCDNKEYIAYYYTPEELRHSDFAPTIIEFYNIQTDELIIEIEVEDLIYPINTAVIRRDNNFYIAYNDTILSYNVTSKEQVVVVKEELEPGYGIAEWLINDNYLIYATQTSAADGYDRGIYIMEYIPQKDYVQREAVTEDSIPERVIR